MTEALLGILSDLSFNGICLRKSKSGCGREDLGLCLTIHLSQLQGRRKASLATPRLCCSISHQSVVPRQSLPLLRRGYDWWWPRHPWGHGLAPGTATCSRSLTRSCRGSTWLFSTRRPSGLRRGLEWLKKKKGLRKTADGRRRLKSNKSEAGTPQVWYSVRLLPPQKNLPRGLGSPITPQPKRR